MEIIARIEIPKYIRKVQMSKAQRKTYFEWNGKTIKSKNKPVPRAFYRDKMNYPENTLIEDLKEGYCITIINDKGKIVDYIKEDKRLPERLTPKWKYILYEFREGYVPVIANPTRAGTPRMYIINGQDIYSGVIGEHAKGFVMDQIKKCYLPYIKDLPVITEYPIQIDCEIHDTIKNAYIKTNDEIGHRWDLDNLAYPYLKAFPDILVKKGKLKDDDRLHLTNAIGAIFIPIENHEDRKLVFIISKAERPEIVNNETYKKYHKDSYESEDTELVKDDEPFPDNEDNKFILTVKKEYFKDENI